MDEDFDLERFVDLFDTAMSSNNPTVKKSFKNLLMVAALAEGENQDPKIGPLRGLLKSVENLQQRVAVLEASKSSTYGPVPTPYTPTWTITNPVTTPVTTVGIAPTYTSTTTNMGSSSSGYSLDNIYQTLDTK